MKIGKQSLRGIYYWHSKFINYQNQEICSGRKWIRSLALFRKLIDSPIFIQKPKSKDPFKTKSNINQLFPFEKPKSRCDPNILKDYLEV